MKSVHPKGIKWNSPFQLRSTIYAIVQPSEREPKVCSSLRIETEHKHASIHATIPSYTLPSKAIEAIILLASDV